MVEILRNKNLATKFQILVEIANRGPSIQQRDIAQKLAGTPQAISDYTRQLVRENLLRAEGRSRYQVTTEGVNWIIKTLRELRGYHTAIEQAVTNISVCAAVAEADLTQGQTVGLEMKDGLLFATKKAAGGAKGIAANDASAGEDVGVANIEGIVGLDRGKVTILKVPGIQHGGSQMVDADRLEKELAGRKLTGAIGIEAIVALKKLNAKSSYRYGVAEAAIEAANSGLASLIVCVDDEISGLVSRLEAEGIDYELVDLRKSTENADT
jgi:putative transcriptional regulator